MKKNILGTIALVATFSVGGYFVGKNENLQAEKEKIESLQVELDTTEKENSSLWANVGKIENDNVTVNYVEYANETFDIEVYPKNGFNVIPEFEFESGKYYKHAYLVGMKKDFVQEANDKFFGGEKVSWDNY